MPVPAGRIRAVNLEPLRPSGRYVLYWMTACRRLDRNFALQRAIEVARATRRPLAILEALRSDYPWASDRLHTFVIDGMAEHARALAGTPVTYRPYVEPSRGAGKGLLERLARDAASVVTDDYPCFFPPRMIAAAGARLPVRLEAVDSNGLLPMRATDKTFSTAVSFRAHVQRTLRAHLKEWPDVLDLSDLPDGADLPADIDERWPATPAGDLEDPSRLVATLPIDHGVPPVPTRGGSGPARQVLRRFVSEALAAYPKDHNQPEADGTSMLSPYLHFGHISTHEVFEAVMTAEKWTTRKLAPDARGRREGWWGASTGAEAFLDQVITWRELGFNLCATRPDDYWTFVALPDWARATLDRHRADPREWQYSRDDLEQARTHDEVWNAAQRQLLRDGWMHNYLRMLWGKKLLEWSPSPEAALDSMIAIMNRHSLDGRDPNSYTGYLWTLGRYDRPWAPERPIYGTVRYMSSANTVKKLRMKTFLRRYGPPHPRA
jgi:deoxyribodipyrimidine photo-lyase